ncbi:MAG: (d)CMP kinase [Treponema sp.]
MNVQYEISKGKELRVAISGKSGCGNTTVSSILASKLSIPCINYTFKNLSEELGLTVKEIMEKARTDFSFDRAVDTKQIALSKQSSCILASRLAIWLLKDADLKVYLYASSDKRAERVHKREGGDFEALKAFTETRDSEDTKRYKELYSIDNNDYSFVDLLIDTDSLTPEEIVKLILDKLLEKSLIIMKA